MITSYLQGGLGNQMFQIAAAYSLSLDINVNVGFCSDLHHASLQAKSVNRYKNNILSKVNFVDKQAIAKNFVLYKESKFSYNQIPQIDNIALLGYFQSYKYFEKNSKEIRILFEENSETTSYIDSKYSHINFKKACSLHVRRGDYLRFQEIHPVCSKEYYDEAVNINCEDVDNILVFSDDLQWCKDNLKYDNLIFISDEDYNEMYLMSRCKNNIIANSSFSWWAAWLNNNIDKKIVCPNKWFGPKGHKDTQDLFPKDWRVL